MKEHLVKQLHRDRDTVVNFCQKHTSIYLYGTGECAASFLLYLNEENIEIQGFVVSEDHKTENQYMGYPVFEIDQISIENSGIILSVAGKYHEELIDYLERKGFNVKRDVLAQTIYYSVNDYLITPADAYYGVEKDGRFFKRFDELDRLGLKTGTDKNSLKHDYLRKYELFLSQFKKYPITIMELGVFNGESIQMWEQYYPNAHVIGVDIDEKCKKYANEKTEIEICDLGKVENIEILGEKYKPNIVVEDASHFWSHQIKAIDVLLPHVSDGGVYIMEDIGTSFGKYRKSRYSDAIISGYDFMSGLAELVAGKELNSNSDKLGFFEREMKELAMMIDMISFVYGSIVVIKK